MIWIIIFIDIILFIGMIYSWNRLYGLLGGYGKGVWANSSKYMVEARKQRFNWTLMFLIYIVLTIFI